MNKNKNHIRKMFDSISDEYDFLNNVITIGQHLKWKSEIVEIAKSVNPKLILDLATGTSDIAINLSQIKNCKIIGVDISNDMLLKAQKKIDKKNLSEIISLETGDAQNLKFNDNKFDIVTIDYGIRNFEQLEAGLKESYRVLKDDGLLIILETSVPSNKFLKFLYNIYTLTFIPVITRVFSNNPAAYNYLEKSAKEFPYGKNLKNILLKVGFSEVEFKPKMLGASTIYTSKK